MSEPALPLGDKDSARSGYRPGGLSIEKQAALSYDDDGPLVCKECGLHGEGPHLTPEACLGSLEAVVVSLEALLAIPPDSRAGVEEVWDTRMAILHGEGLGPNDRINLLREQIAILEFQVEAPRRKPVPPGTRGGFHGRRDARMVVLDGQRLTITAAGRRLGMSAGKLHFRIAKVVGTDDYGEVDLCQIPVDLGRAPMLPAGAPVNTEVHAS